MERPRDTGLAAPTKRADTFDEIAREYEGKDPATMPMRIYSEVFTLFEILGDIEGASVLELACSDGYFSRHLSEWGAGKVVAIDISPEMIALAEARHPGPHPRIEYLVRDARHMGVLGTFDVVFTPYLLDHAHTRAELVQMCRTAYENLAPGGCFVALSNHPDSFPPDAVVERFGIVKQKPTAFRDETPFTLALVMPGETPQRIPFTGYYYTRETFEAVLEEVGFAKVRWHELLVSAEGVAEQGEGYWEEYLEQPCNIAFEARRRR